MRQRLHPTNCFGFTLIEVMISVCIIAVLTSIATPLYLRYTERARNAVAVSDLQNIEAALMNYFTNHSVFPDDLSEVNKDDFLDPWGRPYQYLRILDSESNEKSAFRKDHFLVPVNSDFDLYSMGRDGESVSPFTANKSRDDIVRAFNGKYYGKVSDM